METEISSYTQQRNLGANSPANTRQPRTRPSAGDILPPESHRNRTGNITITVLEDNQYYLWNTLDALSWYFNDYTLNLVHTNWDANTLANSIQGSDLVLIPYGHWVNNYDYDSFRNVIQNYVAFGGGVLFTGKNNSYGIFDNAHEYGNACCGYGFDTGYYDETHPIMEGVDNWVDLYSFSTSYVNDGEFQSVMNVDWWGYDYSHTIFTKEFGTGKVVVFGPYFESWYDDEARMLANAVQFTALSSDWFSTTPDSGTIAAGVSEDVTLSYASYGLGKGEYSTILDISSNDISVPVVSIPQVIRVVGPPKISVINSWSTSYDENSNATESNIGQVHFLENGYADLIVTNFDSNLVTVSVAMENTDSEFTITGTDVQLAPFESGSIGLSIEAGLDEYTVFENAVVTTSHPEMSEHSVNMIAQFVPRYEPIILNIEDVTPDQGGWVTMEFTRSYFDGWFGANARTEIYTVELMHEGNWTAANSSVAYQNNRYHALAHTLQDSGVHGDGLTEFRVIAGMDEGTWSSQSVIGYSVDNIAPGVPTGLQLIANNTSIIVVWDPSGDDDFQYFIMERSTNADFTADGMLGFEMADTIYTDEAIELDQEYFYRIAAIDYAGNKSDYTEPMSATALAIDLANMIPDVFALHQNYPNPFNPVTLIRYDLPEDTDVLITIYDLRGRVIKSLIKGMQTAGYRSIRWNATNNSGEPVSAGMYIYSIQAGKFHQTKKMILLK